MFKINVEDIRAKQYRLFHSKKFRGFNFIKLRNELKDKDDLQGLNELITDYLIEKNEIDYTWYSIFRGLAFGMLGIISMFLMYNAQIGLNFIIVFGVSFTFFVLSNKKKNDVVLGQMGIDISDDYFKQKIKEKFNL